MKGLHGLGSVRMMFRGHMLAHDRRPALLQAHEKGSKLDEQANSNSLQISEKHFRTDFYFIRETK